MKKFYSISQYPGKTGKYFYSSFFSYYNLDYSYTPLGSTNLKQTLDEILPSASGISISMPFKQEVLEYLDYKDETLLAHESCNTIKILNNKLYGYNCDFEGVCELAKIIKPHETISILGNGCMGKMFAKYLVNKNPAIFSRSLNNWYLRHNSFNVVINCTSLGTSSDESPLDHIASETKLVIDLALKDNTLKKLCLDKNITYIEGIEFYKAQFLKQFEIYTDIKPDSDFFDFIYQRMNQ